MEGLLYIRFLFENLTTFNKFKAIMRYIKRTNMKVNWFIIDTNIRSAKLEGDCYRKRHDLVKKNFFFI